MLGYKLYFIRHGITEGNLDGRYIGRTDLPLCKEGVRQIRRLKKEREYPEVQKVYTSPLLRCLETAEILYPNRMVQLVAQLREYDFGSFDGKSIGELVEDPDFARWSDSGMKMLPKGMEDMQSFRERCEAGLSEVITDMMAKKITTAACIVHGGILMNLLAVFGYPKREAVYWKTEPGEGFTALVTTQLWQRDQLFEVFDPLPYHKNDQHEPSSYTMMDLDEEDEG